MKLLYVCPDFPYPPVHGGLVDMWNRIQALHRIGVTVDVVATAAGEPPAHCRTEVGRAVRRLIIANRRPTRSGLLSFKPAHVAIRDELRHIKLTDTYDVVLMQTEFTAEILLNKTLRYRSAIIRVDNDEYGYCMRAARAERRPWRKLYFLQEAMKIRHYSSRVLPIMDMLWFVSRDELCRYKRQSDPQKCQEIEFIPAAIDLRLLSQSPLEGFQVLFVGNLWTPLNQQAVEWYVRNVHPKLNDVPDYHLVIAGSTQSRPCEWVRSLTKPFTNIETYYDPVNLDRFYKESAVFINPMQAGTGVKLKTIEAALRGLPVVSTSVGAEGSGFIDGIHFKGAESAGEFETGVRDLLDDRRIAREFVKRSQEFVLAYYDQAKVLERVFTRMRVAESPMQPSSVSVEGRFSRGVRLST